MPKVASNKFSSPVTVAELGVRVGDPMQHLRDSHARIERSLVTVQNAVAGFSATAPALRAEAAAALDYELALLQLFERLHTQDEEQSFFPRLRAAVVDDSAGIAELLRALESQHRQEEALFEELAACVRSFASVGSQEAEDQKLSKLESLVRQLANLCQPHMTLEEERLIAGCAKYLKPSDLEQMRDEMRVRFKA
jgi:hypothetical protein